MQTTSFRSLTAQCAIALFIGLHAFSSTSNASTLNHGDYAAVNVTYLDVTETSSDPLPLYGAPVVIGDSLEFFDAGSSNPSLGFNAQSTGGFGDLTDGFLNVTIESNSATTGINAISFSEGGDYTMSALGSALAQVSATLNIFELAIVEVDGVAIAPITLSDIQNATFNLPADPNSGAWHLSSSFDLNAALASNGQSYTYGATKLTAKVNNTLTALSESGSVAGIFKKDFDIDTETMVPEPTSLALAAFGIVAVLAKRRTS